VENERFGAQGGLRPPAEVPVGEKLEVSSPDFLVYVGGGQPDFEIAVEKTFAAREQLVEWYPETSVLVSGLIYP